MAVAFCFTFSQKLEANGKGNLEIKYSLGMPNTIEQKNFWLPMPFKQ